MEFRFAEPNDLKALAAIRGTDDNSESYWFNRISGYYHGTHSPQQALTPRVIIIATDDFRVIGFVAGHLTRRYDFDGELQWIDTIPDYRGKGHCHKFISAFEKLVYRTGYKTHLCQLRF
ncbi:hypothetical protein ABID99_001041 [Mucilaginibacter sp. OAE612]|uniref:GNAT family N-acetyltransferase n=1 Tax=Mucilaginibacter sp. OAE612 TaxID=3156444 RepID=UPI00359E93AA